MNSAPRPSHFLQKQTTLAVAKLALQQNRVEDLPSLIVSISLHEQNLGEAAYLCLSLAAHQNRLVRGNAILGLGHLARRFGRIPEAAHAVIARGLNDPSQHVRGQASAAADDLTQFIGRQPQNNSLQS